jgi:hypothetical protein
VVLTRGLSAAVAEMVGRGGGGPTPPANLSESLETSGNRAKVLKVVPLISETSTVAHGNQAAARPSSPSARRRAASELVHPSQCGVAIVGAEPYVHVH